MPRQGLDSAFWRYSSDAKGFFGSVHDFPEDGDYEKEGPGLRQHPDRRAARLLVWSWQVRAEIVLEAG